MRTFAQAWICFLESHKICICTEADEGVHSRLAPSLTIPNNGVCEGVKARRLTERSVLDLEQANYDGCFSAANKHLTALAVQARRLVRDSILGYHAGPNS